MVDATTPANTLIQKSAVTTEKKENSNKNNDFFIKSNLN